MARRSGLGKGLGALIPTEARDRDSALREVPMTSIRPNPLQPRTRFDEEAMSSLAVVDPRGRGAPAHPGAGDRRGRVRAHRRRASVAGGPPGRAPDDAGPGPERRPMSTASSRRWSRTSIARTSTPSRRRAPSSSSSTSSATPTSRWPPGWARAGRRSPTPCGCSSSRPASSGPWPTATISAGHARALLGTPDRSFQEELAKRIVAEGLTVRAVEEGVRHHAQGADR